MIRRQPQLPTSNSQLPRWSGSANLGEKSPLWRVASLSTPLPRTPLLAELEVGSWQLRPSPTTNKVHNLHLIALGDGGRRQPIAFDDREVVLDGDPPGIDLKALEQLQ